MTLIRIKLNSVPLKGHLAIKPTTEYQSCSNAKTDKSCSVIVYRSQNTWQPAIRCVFISERLHVLSVVQVVDNNRRNAVIDETVNFR